MTIRHFLADGTEVESIEGRVIPPTGQTESVYRLIALMLSENDRQNVNKGLEQKNRFMLKDTYAPSGEAERGA